MVVRSPCQENYPADAHPSAHKSVLESANPAWTRSVHLDAPGQRHGQQPVSGTADPGVVKQDKASRGSVDTTKTRSDPQRVRMSSGERPIGAAKGKQPNTEALCRPPPPSFPTEGRTPRGHIEHCSSETSAIPSSGTDIPISPPPPPTPLLHWGSLPKVPPTPSVSSPQLPPPPPHAHLQQHLNCKGCTDVEHRAIGHPLGPV